MRTYLSTAALCAALCLPATAGALAQQGADRAPVGRAPATHRSLDPAGVVEGHAAQPCPGGSVTAGDPSSDPDLADRTVGPGNALTPNPDYGRC